MAPRDGCCHNRYYLNALFDLEIGGFPVDKVKRSAAEMSVLFLSLCAENDAIVLDVEVQQEYLTYLFENRILQSRAITIFSENDSPFGQWSDIVWGWNGAAAKRFGVSTQSLQQPNTDTITLVNGRHFCYNVAFANGYGVHGSKFCHTINDLDDLLVVTCLPFPLVIKPAFGTSGYGLLVVNNKDELTQMRSQISKYSTHGGFVVESWCRRCFDLSTGGVINNTGSVVKITMHSQWVNTFGAFFGIYIEDEDSDLAPWRDKLLEMTTKYLAAAASVGYFGQIGIDSFLYRDESDVVQLAAGIEINGRYTMGTLAHQLRNRFAPKSCFLLRFIGRKQCALPPTYDELVTALGQNNYNAATGTGILLLTPLRVGFGGVWKQPQRSAFIIVAFSRELVMQYDTVLVGCFSRKKEGFNKSAHWR